MEIKDYKKGDERHILKLFENSFGKPLSIDYWKWRFLQNPFEEKKYINLMWENDLLVGHYAVSPIQMLFEGEKKKTCLSMTTMTHRNYFGKGIFSSLANALYDKIKKDNFEMVWGFPNKNSHYGFKKNLMWTDIDIIPMMRLNQTNIKNLEGDVSYQRIYEVSDNVGHNLNYSTSLVKINKTREYLNWRYVDNPGENYNILSLKDNNEVIIIYKKIPSFSNKYSFEIDIMELAFGDDLESIKGIIRAVLLEEKEEIYQINLWKNIHDYNEILFEKMGFTYSQPLTFLGYKSFTNNLLPSHMKNWDISFGYSDVY